MPCTVRRRWRADKNQTTTGDLAPLRRSLLVFQMFLPPGAPGGIGAAPLCFSSSLDWSDDDGSDPDRTRWS